MNDRKSEAKRKKGMKKRLHSISLENSTLTTNIRIHLQRSSKSLYVCNHNYSV